MISKGSLSSEKVWGTNPYSTGKITDEGITRSNTNASHSLLYSYLSLDPDITSITAFKMSGGLPHLK